jgi:hypothetical protein
MQYTKALDFTNKGTVVSSPDLIWLLTNYKRKGFSGDIIKLYIEKRLPFDLDVVKLGGNLLPYDKLKKLMEDNEKENAEFIKKFLPHHRVNVKFNYSPQDTTIKVSSRGDYNVLSIDEVKVLGPQSTICFYANPYITTKEEYQLIYILCTDLLIINKEAVNREEWVMQQLQPT